MAELKPKISEGENALIYLLDQIILSEDDFPDSTLNFLTMVK